MRRLLATEALPAMVLIRIVVGGVFLTEGFRNFFIPLDWAAGALLRSEFPFPK